MSTKNLFVTIAIADVVIFGAVQLILSTIDIAILIYIWKVHMKDVDFEEIRRSW